MSSKIDLTRHKILLINLVSNGDCIYVTAIARKIKIDYPNCHLTWAISNLCKQILINNNDVDDVRIIEIKNVKEGLFDAYYEFQNQLKVTGLGDKFDMIFTTQFFPVNLNHFDGTIRSTLFRGYPNYKGLDVTPIVNLTSEEVSNVAQFVEKQQIKSFQKVILFECSPASGQSFVTPEIAIEIATKLVNFYPDMMVILSTHLNLNTNNSRIIVANEISFRENAELVKYCDLLVGASSGITWLTTSDWVKKEIPMIQLINKNGGASFASVAYDLEFWGKNANLIVEITNRDTTRIVECIKMFYAKGIETCRVHYHEQLKPNPFFIKDYFNMLAKKGRIAPLLGLFRNFSERNGFSFKLALAFIYIILQGLIRLPVVLLRKNHPSVIR